MALMAAGVVCATLLPCQVRAQWWSSGPADFEDCADRAEKAATKEARIAALSQCNAKFAGRRKAGGGYTYFDFMQNRTFDIAGPNPTPEEQRQIDEQYTAYLESQRRKSIKAALLAKQQQMQQTSPKGGIEKAMFTTESTSKPQPPPSGIKHVRPTACPRPSFSCDWPRLSEGIKGLKKALFGPPQSKAGRSQGASRSSL